MINVMPLNDKALRGDCLVKPLHLKTPRSVQKPWPPPFSQVRTQHSSPGRTAQGAILPAESQPHQKSKLEDTLSLDSSASDR